jgi:hypothetical protein
VTGTLDEFDARELVRTVAKCHRFRWASESVLGTRQNQNRDIVGNSLDGTDGGDRLEIVNDDRRHDAQASLRDAIEHGRKIRLRAIPNGRLQIRVGSFQYVALNTIAEFF